MLTTAITWPPFYIHYVFFPFFEFNFRKTTFCCLMLKAAYFSWFLVFWVSFACWFLMFLNCCYFFFFFFFYSCTVTTTGTTTTITSNSVNEGKRTSETSYKLWSSEFWSIGGRKEQATPKLVLLPALGLGSMHTHKVWLQYKICTGWCNPTYIYFLYTWVLKLASKLSILVCFWTYSHVMNNLCSNFGRRRKRRE